MKGSTELLRDYLHENYVSLVREISLNHKNNRGSGDFEILSALSKRSLTPSVTADFMRRYGLFQGKSKDIRDALADSATDSLMSLSNRYSIDNYKRGYRRIYEILYKVHPQRWTSASSKLLWCRYPRHVVIYDQFVWRTLLVLQKLDPKLSELGKLTAPSPVSNTEQIADDNNHYFLFVELVQEVMKSQTNSLNKLKEKHKTTYQFDVRIIDKMLWRIGSSR